MVNLVVRLPGRRPERILFTGHYDTKLMPAAQNFVGASDGGSSAAFLIELARVLKASPAHEYTYELVWFDGEEAVVEWSGDDHTYGSQHYVNAATQAGALTSIKAMILVDMIGDRDLQIRRENKSTRWLTDIIWTTARRIGHANTFLDAATDIEDDHVPFLDAGVPAVDIIDLDYPQWHNEAACCDDLEHVAARSLQIVADVVIASIPEIERFLLR
jgi:glutaminyl-peptide cyclotransferase